MNHLVIGSGEVGTALMEIFGAPGHDPMKGILSSGVFDCIHICFPYSDKFDNLVKEYSALFSASFVIIHSTVPIGTSKKLNALHSPIRGQHPNLAKSIKTFVKFVGGVNAFLIADEMMHFGINAIPVENSDDTEAGKLLDLLQYADSIMIEKEINSFCKKNNIDFDVAYSLFNKTYNDGYSALGLKQFIRPNLKHVPGPIGGHCVIQNIQMLKMKSTDRIIEENKNDTNNN